MNVFEMLMLRTEFEEIVHNYKVPGDKKQGTLDTFKWFLESGASRNRFRDGFKRAEEICNMILNHELNRVKIW